MPIGSRLTRLLLATLSCALTLTACQRDQGDVGTVEPLAVEAMAARPSEEILWLEALGRSEGAEEIDVLPQVSGTLQEISYREGDAVSAGQTLFVIDPAPFQAALDAASATARQRAAELRQAEREAGRYQKLWQARACSRKEYDDARSAAEIAAASLRQAQAEERDARINLSYTTVKAPSAGIAARARVNRGALVSASSTLLTTLSQPDRMRVNFAVSERDLDGRVITAANRVRLFEPSGREIKASLDYIAREINHESATLTLRALVDDPSTTLLPGQYVHVQLEREKLSGVFRVPQKAVLQRPDGTYRVYLAVDGRAKSRDVTLGQWKDTDWIVLTGLREGDQVLLTNLQRMREDMPLKITPVEPTRPPENFGYGVKTDHTAIERM